MTRDCGNVPAGTANEKLIDAWFTVTGRAQSKGETVPLVRVIEAGDALAAEVARLEREREAENDYVGWAISCLESGAPSRTADEGHYANRALTYLYSIRDGRTALSRAVPERSEP